MGVKKLNNRFSRTELLYGKEIMQKFAKSRVAVFGVGGVGGYAAEALARSGIGSIDLIDNDKICLSNINRQIFALESTIGKYKADTAKDRLLDINPDININVHKIFYLPENSALINFKNYDYVIDAIDTVAGKIEIIEQAKKAGVSVISSMGAGNKTDPTKFEITDIYSTSVCPLAKVMRSELKKRGITDLKVVYSKQKPIKPKLEISMEAEQSNSKKRAIPGSTAFVPSVAGLIIAGEVLNDLALSEQA